MKTILLIYIALLCVTLPVDIIGKGSNWSSLAWRRYATVIYTPIVFGFMLTYDLSHATRDVWREFVEVLKEAWSGL